VSFAGINTSLLCGRSCSLRNPTFLEEFRVTLYRHGFKHSFRIPPVSGKSRETPMVIENYPGVYMEHALSDTRAS